jgi:hypothetical protein
MRDWGEQHTLDSFVVFPCGWDGQFDLEPVICLRNRGSRVGEKDFIQRDSVRFLPLDVENKQAIIENSTISDLPASIPLLIAFNTHN